MQVFLAVIGAAFLFFGRELIFLFAASMAALIGLRLTPLLPPQWPAWSDYAFILGLALIAARLIRRERIRYFLTGFLVGSYFLVEYSEPGVLTLPVLPFIVGGVIGSIIIGIFTQWALMVISSLVGAYFLTNLFNLSPIVELLVGAGLFVIGAVTQALMMQMQTGGDEEI